MMRAVVKTGDGEVGYTQVPALPAPGPGEILIDVAAVGVCGTDRNEIAGTTGMIPRIPGHEVAGVVAAIGPAAPGVPITVAVGDRVVLETDAYLCRDCEWCRTEQFNRCPNRTGIGRSAHGGLAEQILIRADAAHRLPDTATLLEGALAEPLAVAVHSVLELPLGVEPGAVVVVIGPGAVGQLVAQVAHAAGARVVMLGRDRHAARLATARAAGAVDTFSTESDDVAGELGRLTGGRGADVVFECSGVPAEVQRGLALLGKGGRLGLVAMYAEPVEIDVMTVVNNELQVHGCRGKRASSFRTAMTLLGDGRLALLPVIGAVYGLEDWDRAVDDIGQGVKVVMLPGGAPLDAELPAHLA